MSNIDRARNNINYKRTPRGKLNRIYDSQISCSKKRGHNPPEYTKEEFVGKYINDSNYLSLHNDWVLSMFNKDYAPSFDRKNDYKPYSFNNIQVMHWFENRVKSYSDKKNGINNKNSKAIIGTNTKTGGVIEFYSMSEAGRNGFSFSNIGACCRGDRNSHKGYTWKYKETL